MESGKSRDRILRHHRCQRIAAIVDGSTDFAAFTRR